MSLFQKAESEATRLKMYIYGKTGTGKTVTALHFPSPAVIDAEDGTLHYGGIFDFHKIKTNDPKKVHEAIDELLENPGDFKTLVVDPMSMIYDQILKDKEDRMKMKTGNLHYELQPLDYKTIKTEVKLLMNKLLSLDMNVIVTTRSKPQYAQGKFMQQIGEQPEGHRDMPYMFDVVLELYQTEDGTRMARVEKDRTNKLPHEFKFSYDSFVEHIGIESLERDADVDLQRKAINEKNNRTNSIMYKGEKMMTAGIDAATLERLETLLEDIPQEKIIETLKEEFEVESLLDLTDKNAQAFLKAVEEQMTDGED